MSDPASLLPSNSSSVERAIERAMAEGKSELGRVISTFWDPRGCPADLLPWLAWALSVEEWEDEWSESTRRDVVAESIKVHQLKGTIPAVQRALEAAGFGAATVVERYGWEFYDGSSIHDGSVYYDEPDHWAEYRVRMTRPITIAQAQDVRRILRSVAPARCHLKALDFSEAINLYDAQITYDGQFTHGVA